MSAQTQGGTKFMTLERHIIEGEREHRRCALFRSRHHEPARHLGLREQALPTIVRWRADLGVLDAVVALVEPGPPELIELVESRRLAA